MKSTDKTSGIYYTDRSAWSLNKSYKISHANNILQGMFGGDAVNGRKETTSVFPKAAPLAINFLIIYDDRDAETLQKIYRNITNNRIVIKWHI